MSQVFYRKYRPQSFDEVYGQEHVVTILRNQLKTNQVAHAYLFAGPRGTGKTSVARILARELGVSEIDLLEIDAASHRGIDDIRNLREAVAFQPSQGSKKLYILDEAHMLTQEAFNALLKTLEEPPTYVHFILCTTEPHRIPITIRSRCQRLNFGLANKEVIKLYLQRLASREKVEISGKVLDAIAEKSGGSFRDAVMLLEQVTSYQNGKAGTPESILKSLGFGLEQEVAGLARKIVQKDVEGFIAGLNELVSTGVDTTAILGNLISQLREWLIHEQADSEMPPGLHRLALVRLIRGLSSARVELKSSSLPQLPIELAVLEWAASLESTNDDSQNKVAQSVPAKKVKRVVPVSSPGGEVGSSPVDLPWNKIMQRVREFNHSLEALLKASEPLALEGKLLTLLFKYKFHKEKVEESLNRRLVEQAISEVLGRNIKVRCLVKADKKTASSARTAESGLPIDSYPGRRVKDAPNDKSADDILKVAQEVFGGEIIE